MKKNIRLSRTELANRLIAISEQISLLSKHINNTDANHYITNINILSDVDKKGYCDEENNRVEKQWYADYDLFDEEDTRRECINRTLIDLRKVVDKYVDKADEGLLGELKVGDFDTIYYSVNDIGYANDLNDTMCVDDNWYNLFDKVKKVKPDKLSRDTIFNTEDKPTSLCQDKHKHDMVKDIISKLKEIDIDGETMQYILKQVGMEEQMHRQLVMDKDFKQTKDLLREKFEAQL